MAFEFETKTLALNFFSGLFNSIIAKSGRVVLCDLEFCRQAAGQAWSVWARMVLAACGESVSFCRTERPAAGMIFMERMAFVGSSFKKSEISRPDAWRNSRAGQISGKWLGQVGDERAGMNPRRKPVGLGVGFETISSVANDVRDVMGCTLMTTTALERGLQGGLGIVILTLIGLVGSAAALAQGANDAPAVSDGPSLESQLMPLIKAHHGKVAVAVKDLKTGESFRYHAEVPMPTASLIKLPVMVEAYRQADAKTLDLKKTVTLKKEDKVPGSGILTEHFSEGATFPLLDAVHLMIVFSDNTATNLVLDEIGLKSTADTFEKMGYPHTKIHSKVYRRDTSVFPERSKKFGLGSTNADEMIQLFEALHEKKIVSPEASEAMLKHLTACDDKDKFPRFLPPGTKIAFKTGSVDKSRTAAGIIECGRGPVVLCVMTDENEDHRYVPDNAGNRLCADVARVVFDHFKTGPAAEPTRPKTP